jgi:hypothetical protein
LFSSKDRNALLAILLMFFCIKNAFLGWNMEKSISKKLAIAVSMAQNSRYNTRKLHLPVELKCPFCKRVFDDPAKLRRHRMNDHKMDTASSNHNSTKTV